MGYILPVQGFQYQDYQRRIIEIRRNPYYIDKPYKVILEAYYEEMKENPSPKENPVQRSNQLVKERHKTDVIYANITGKGKHISEKV